MKKFKKVKVAESSETNADSTIVLGDLTEVKTITRAGNIVTLHGDGDSRSYTLPDKEVAAAFWSALASEASEAIREDRQFFCVSFGRSDPLSGEETLH